MEFEQRIMRYSRAMNYKAIEQLIISDEGVNSDLYEVLIKWSIGNPSISTLKAFIKGGMNLEDYSIKDFLDLAFLVEAFDIIKFILLTTNEGISYDSFINKLPKELQQEILISKL